MAGDRQRVVRVVAGENAPERVGVRVVIELAGQLVNLGDELPAGVFRLGDEAGVAGKLLLERVERFVDRRVVRDDRCVVFRPSAQRPPSATGHPRRSTSSPPRRRNLRETLSHRRRPLVAMRPRRRQQARTPQKNEQCMSWDRIPARNETTGKLPSACARQAPHGSTSPYTENVLCKSARPKSFVAINPFSVAGQAAHARRPSGSRDTPETARRRILVSRAGGLRAQHTRVPAAMMRPPAMTTALMRHGCASLPRGLS